MQGELVGAGRTAEIFAIDAATVLKLWRPGWGAEDADEEIAVAERIAATGAHPGGDTCSCAPGPGARSARV